MYFERPLHQTVQVALEDTPVVCVLGPRQAGKTTLAQQFEPSYRYVTLDDASTLAFAQGDPTGFVAALPDPVILDEVQRAPGLLRAIKLSVDADRRAGRYLLTGSANLLLLPQIGDSLAGRMEIVELQPLTAAEQNQQAGLFVSALLAGRLRPELRSARLPDPSVLVGQVVAGGFPEAVKRPADRARTWHRQYLRALLERDVQDVARVRDPRELARLLELLALRTAQLLNVATLTSELGLRRETAERYLAICERLFLVRRLPAWHHNHATRLIKTPKIHFVDSGLAATLSSFTSGDVLDNRTQFGHLLESFAVQQLIAQAGWTAPELVFSHYRDKDQVEVDLVMERGRDVWGVEVKAAATVTPSDGAGLRRLADRCGRHFRGGVLLYGGTATVSLSVKGCLAVPLARLWDM